jgi:DNA processing protein
MMPEPSTATRLLKPNGGEWPTQLNELGPHRTPLTLFAEGKPLPKSERAIAIVGTRRPTHSGLELAGEFARAVTEAGYAVVSGFALGIDATAHRACLEAGGHTVAVLGCGLDVNYPERHGALRRQVRARGTLVTEYEPGTPPHSYHFPSRNRIIVGLVRAVIVIEGGLRSGALITARIANDSDRTVFAVPGSPRNAVAIGPNELIRRGEAALVANPEHLFEALAPEVTWDRPYQPGDRPDLSDSELRVLHALESVPINADQICNAFKLQPGEVSLALAKLELRGLARRTRTGRFEITEAGIRISLATA